MLSVSKESSRFFKRDRAEKHELSQLEWISAHAQGAHDVKAEISEGDPDYDEVYQLVQV